MYYKRAYRLKEVLMKDTKEILTCPACGGVMTKISARGRFFY